MLSLIKAVEQQGLITQFCLIPIKELKENTITELDMSGKNLGVDGAVVLATYLKDNGALSSLNLKDNQLASKEAGAALGSMLKTNTSLKALDISQNTWKDVWGDPEGDGPGFAQEIAIGLQDNGAMSILNVSNNNIGAEGAKALVPAM